MSVEQALMKLVDNLERRSDMETALETRVAIDAVMVAVIDTLYELGWEWSMGGWSQRAETTRDDT